MHATNLKIKGGVVIMDSLSTLPRADVVHLRASICWPLQLFIFVIFFPDLTPRITRQPKSQNAHWRGTVTFWCEASTSGGDISYQWLRGAENMPKESRSRLTIKDVKKCHRGEYKCVVTSDFGTAESQPARLMIGKCSKINIM